MICLHAVLLLFCQCNSWHARATRPRHVATQDYRSLAMPIQDTGTDPADNSTRVTKLDVGTSQQNEPNMRDVINRWFEEIFTIIDAHGHVAGLIELGNEASFWKNTHRLSNISCEGCEWKNMHFEQGKRRVHVNLKKMRDNFFQESDRMNFAAQKYEQILDVTTYISILVSVAMVAYGTRASENNFYNDNERRERESISSARGGPLNQSNDNSDSQPLADDLLPEESFFSHGQRSKYVLALLGVVTIAVDATRSSFQLEVMIQRFRNSQAEYRRLGNNCQGLIGEKRIMAKYDPDIVVTSRDEMVTLYEEWTSTEARSPQLPVYWRKEEEADATAREDKDKKQMKEVNKYRAERVNLLRALKAKELGRNSSLLQTHATVRGHELNLNRKNSAGMQPIIGDPYRENSTVMQENIADQNHENSTVMQTNVVHPNNKKSTARQKTMTDPTSENSTAMQNNMTDPKFENSTKAYMQKMLVVQVADHIQTELQALRTNLVRYSKAYGMIGAKYSLWDRCLLWPKTFLASLVSVSGSFPKPAKINQCGVRLQVFATLVATASVAVLGALRDYWGYKTKGSLFEQASKEFDTADDKVRIFLSKVDDETQKVTVADLKRLVRYIESVFYDVPSHVPAPPLWAWTAADDMSVDELQTGIEKLKQEIEEYKAEHNATI